jgi:hypothetical protein
LSGPGQAEAKGAGSVSVVATTRVVYILSLGGPPMAVSPLSPLPESVPV